MVNVNINMGAFFESALLFSLAVLIILVGLLIYYFKGRIVDIEQKNMKCLEIINDVYKSHLEFKQLVVTKMQEQSASIQQPSDQSNQSNQNQSNQNQSNQNQSNQSDQNQRLLSQSDQRITIEIDEDEDDYMSSDSDSSSSDEDEDEDELKTKLINIDLSIPVNYELDIDELDIDVDESKEEDMDELDIDVEEEEDADEEIKEPMIVVNKIENDCDGITIVTHSDNVERESYRKMNLPALRSFIISKGFQTDSAKLQKMKKNELVDLIMSQ
jgi:hypothetical protein